MVSRGNVGVANAVIFVWLAPRPDRRAAAVVFGWGRVFYFFTVFLLCLLCFRQ